jgi:hypothetical protein
MIIADARSRQKKTWNEIKNGEVFIDSEDSIPMYCMKVTASIYILPEKITGSYIDLEDGCTYGFFGSPDVPRFEVLDTAKLVIE